MSDNKINGIELNDAKKLEAISKITLETITIEPENDAETASIVIDTLKKIPFISSLLRNATDGGIAVTSLLQPRADLLPILGEISFVFHIVPIALFGLDLFYILAASLSAYIMNKPSPIEVSDRLSDKNTTAKRTASPFSLSSLVKVIYSIIFLTIAILVLMIPAVSLPLSLIGGILGLFVSLQALGTFFYQDYQLRKTNNELSKDLGQAELKLNTLKTEAGDLNNPLENTKELASLYSRFKHIENEIKVLKKKKSQCEKELVGMNGKAVFSRFLSVMLSSIAIIGITLLFVAPPVGSAILLGVSLTAIFYTIASIVIPSLLTKSREFVTKWKNDALVVEPADNEKILSMTDKPFNSSTTKMSKLLSTLGFTAKQNESFIKKDGFNDNTLENTKAGNKSNLDDTSGRAEISYTQSLY